MKLKEVLIFLNLEHGTRGIKFYFVQKNHRINYAITCVNKINKEILVSIIIVNFNTFKYTCTCIKSIIQYNQKQNFEIILVDNASSECDANLFLSKFPEIKLIKNKKNLGFAKANNIGIKAALGDIILLLNSDTELVTDAINMCATELKKNKHIGVISAKLTYP